MSEKHVKQTQTMMVREILTIVAFAFVFVSFITQSIYFATPERREKLQKQAEARSTRIEYINYPRGSILDRNGEPLAVSSEIYTLGIDAKIYENNFDNAYQLASITGHPAKDIINKIALQSHSRFVVLTHKLTPSYARQANNFAIKGVSVVRRFERFYPAAETTAQLIGLTDTDENGIEGIELSFDSVLRSRQGKRSLLVSATGSVVKNLQELHSPHKGEDVRLSIDLRLQNYAYGLLEKHVQRVGASSGSVLLIDVPSAQVLAVVNYPAANPNYRASIQPQLMRNRAFVDVFEPGSTIKPLTMAAVFDAGVWQPKEELDIGNGFLKVDSFTIRDVGNHGKWITPEKILVKSSNVGAAKLGLALGSQQLVDAFSRYGFVTTTGSGIAGEQSGNLPLGGSISASRNATMSYGYGVDLTLAQLARAYTALAADGKLMPLHILHHQETTTSGSNHSQAISHSMVFEQVIHPETAQRIRSMLVGVTQQGGTAPNAAIEGFAVAGKTGTVHLIENGRYSYQRYNAIFVGMAPAEAPRLLAAVIVREPQGDNYYGSESAAPIFQRLMAHSLRLVRVDPEI